MVCLWLKSSEDHEWGKFFFLSTLRFHNTDLIYNNISTANVSIIIVFHQGYALSFCKTNVKILPVLRIPHIDLLP